jgi:hypothetical protein
LFDDRTESVYSVKIKSAVIFNRLTILIKLNEFKYTNTGDVILSLAIEQDRNVEPDT